MVTVVEFGWSPGAKSITWLSCWLMVLEVGRDDVVLNPVVLAAVLWVRGPSQSCLCDGSCLVHNDLASESFYPRGSCGRRELVFGLTVGVEF